MSAEMTSSQVPSPTLSPSPTLTQPPNAPPANVGMQPTVSITTVGWGDDRLHLAGTVQNRLGPLWVAVQPAEAESEAWIAEEIDIEPYSASSGEWSAMFADAPPAERYNIKFFLEGLGFGASGAPGRDFGDYLEDEGGAERPSVIFDDELAVVER